MIRLDLDDGMLAMLTERADFHGTAPEDTIRICIRHEWNALRMLTAECDEARRNPEPPGPGDGLPE